MYNRITAALFLITFSVMVIWKERDRVIHQPTSKPVLFYYYSKVVFKYQGVLY